MRPAGLLCDLEGTLYTADTPLPGATRLVPALRAHGIPFRFVTNTTSRSRPSLVSRLAMMGITVSADEIVSAPVAAAALARARGHTIVAPFLLPDVFEDLAGVTLAGGTAPKGEGATAVLVGDLGERWNFDLLQEAYDLLRAGADLITCSRDRAYRKGTALVLDAGPFVAALEYASGTTAHLAGKPSTALYEAAIAELGMAGRNRASILMLGDDMHGDIAGAQQAGLTAWAVETGKFSKAEAAQAGVVPDRIIPSLETFLAGLGE